MPSVAASYAFIDASAQGQKRVTIIGPTTIGVYHMVIAEPSDLHAAIHQAEKIEMARGTVSGNVQSQQSGSWTRGRGRYARGRGRFNIVQQSSGQNSQPQGASGPAFAASQTQGQKQYPSVGYNQCSRCKGWGHWSYDCPSPQQSNFRGGRGGRFARGRAMRGRRGGRNIQRGRGRNTSVNASLTASGSGAPASQPQVQDAAPVPMPPRPGMLYEPRVVGLTGLQSDRLQTQ